MNEKTKEQKPTKTQTKAMQHWSSKVLLTILLLKTGLAMPTNKRKTN